MGNHTDHALRDFLETFQWIYLVPSQKQQEDSKYHKSPKDNTHPNHRHRAGRLRDRRVWTARVIARTFPVWFKWELGRRGLMPSQVRSLLYYKLRCFKLVIKVKVWEFRRILKDGFTTIQQKVTRILEYVSWNLRPSRIKERTYEKEVHRKRDSMVRRLVQIGNSLHPF